MRRGSNKHSTSTTSTTTTTTTSTPFIIGSQIGEGQSCVVHLATLKTGKTVAAKLIPFRTPSCVSAFRREVEALSCISHPNIIRMLDHVLCSGSGSDSYSGSGSYFDAAVESGVVLLELLSPTTLADYLTHVGPFMERQALPLFEQITDAVACVHRCHFAHNDIKPENIIIDTLTMQIKLFDFGLSVPVDLQDPVVAFHGGSPLYMAPEVLCPSHNLLLSDIWSLGITFYELLDGEAPLSYCADLNELVSCLSFGSTFFTYPECISPSMECLLRGILQNDVECRLRLGQIKHKLDEMRYC